MSLRLQDADQAGADQKRDGHVGCPLQANRAALVRGPAFSPSKTLQRDKRKRRAFGQKASPCVPRRSPDPHHAVDPSVSDCRFPRIRIRGEATGLSRRRRGVRRTKKGRRSGQPEKFRRGCLKGEALLTRLGSKRKSILCIAAIDWCNQDLWLHRHPLGDRSSLISWSTGP